MSNRRVKSLAQEDDDFDDDDDFDGGDDSYGAGEDNELSSEDQEQMREGTIKVREALGTAFPVSDKDIQETLWHYYYDVGKSVVYLKSMIFPTILMILSSFFSRST